MNVQKLEENFLFSYKKKEKEKKALRNVQCRTLRIAYNFLTEEDMIIMTLSLETITISIHTGCIYDTNSRPILFFSNFKIKSI